MDFGFQSYTGMLTDDISEMLDDITWKNTYHLLVCVTKSLSRVADHQLASKPGVTVHMAEHQRLKTDSMSVHQNLLHNHIFHPSYSTYSVLCAASLLHVCVTKIFPPSLIHLTKPPDVQKAERDCI